MTGYQEVITDPSYRGQIVSMTYPQIGNYGINPEDAESGAPHIRAFVIGELCEVPSNWRSSQPLSAYLAEHGILGIEGIDTRALTKRIRMGGAPNAVIAHNRTGKFDLKDLMRQAKGWPGLLGMDLASVISTTQNYTWIDGLWTL